jgi:hypothetical protein
MPKKAQFGGLNQVRMAEKRLLIPVISSLAAAGGRSEKSSLPVDQKGLSNS